MFLQEFKFKNIEQQNQIKKYFESAFKELKQFGPEDAKAVGFIEGKTNDGYRAHIEVLSNEQVVISEHYAVSPYLALNKVFEELKDKFGKATFEQN